MHDVGIDGQLEHALPSGEASGRLVTMQVKTRASGLKDPKKDRVS